MNHFAADRFIDKIKNLVDKAGDVYYNKMALDMALFVKKVKKNSNC